MAIARLPPELLEKILGDNEILQFEDIVRSTQVCHFWRHVVFGPEGGGSSMLKCQVWLLDGYNPCSLHQLNGLLHKMLRAYGAQKNVYDKMCKALKDWQGPWVHNFAFHPMFSGFTLLTLYYYCCNTCTGKVEKREHIIPGNRGIELVDIFELLRRLLGRGHVHRVDMSWKFRVTTPEGEMEY